MQSTKMSFDGISFGDKIEIRSNYISFTRQHQEDIFLFIVENLKSDPKFLARKTRSCQNAPLYSSVRYRGIPYLRHETSFDNHLFLTMRNFS